VTERLKKDIIKLVIDEVVIEGESVKIFATIPLPNKIHEREMDKTDIPGTFNAGATLGPINETNMTRIWNKHKQTNTPLKRKVFVGLSGGVDSAVSATLLKKEGYDVTGVFIKAWTPEGYPCAWKEDRRSAMRVAAVLNIPFITLDLEKEYKKEVVDYMIAEYKKGRTPNPDVMCNKEIKFGHFLRFALKNGADFVATGHYAIRSDRQIVEARFAKQLGAETICRSRRVELKEGADKNKDQSYFLWTLTQNQLRHILFPIGYLQKSEVRKLAEKFGLPQAARKDSQGLCFLGKVDMKEFLSRYIPQKRGDVLLEKNEIIGHHNGTLFFTIGERHGFTITKKSDKETPLYVVAKNISKNTITVAPIQTERSSQLYIKEVELKDLNIINEIKNKKLSCRIRYRQEKAGCRAEKDGKKIKIYFDKPQIGVSPGQSLVLYDNEICLGGGIIS
jgi:tRNA-specific 2-thiouridylase